ncbi:MAG: hypothetical protein JSV00_08305 [bacterium]|nr:MAG: hypothetical protein JSV00_08305 [bacterium]
MPEATRLFPGVLSFETVNAYIALTAAVLNFAFALLALARTSRETLYVTFSLVCLGVAFWNFADFMIFASGNPIWLPPGAFHQTPWKKLVSLGSCLAVASLFHFTSILVERAEKNRFWIILAYAAAFPLALTPVLTPLSDLIYRFWVGIGWNLVFFFLLFPFLLSCMVMVASAMERAGEGKERSWLKFILLAIIIQVATGLTDLFHKMQLSLPPLGHLGSVLGPMVLAAGLYRHRKAFDELAQTRKKLDLLSSMAAEIAHEIRSSLTAIKGLTRLRADLIKKLDLEKIRQYQDILVEEFQRIEGILASLQDFTRPLIIEKEPVKVNEVVRKTVRLTNLEDLKLEIDLNLDDSLPAVQADPSLLKQVFLNLLRNAAEACGQDGRLRIATSLNHGSLAIEFVDNGPGVPEEVQARVFEPFFSTKDSGFGLGLAVIARILEAHGGAVSIENVQPTGAKVTVLLPV